MIEADHPLIERLDLVRTYLLYVLGVNRHQNIILPIFLGGGKLDLVFSERYNRILIDIGGVLIFPLIFLRLVVLDLSAGVQLEEAELLLAKPVALVQVALLDDSQVVFQTKTDPRGHLRALVHVDAGRLPDNDLLL